MFKYTIFAANAESGSREEMFSTPCLEDAVLRIEGMDIDGEWPEGADAVTVDADGTELYLDDGDWFPVG